MTVSCLKTYQHLTKALSNISYRMNVSPKLWRNVSLVWIIRGFDLRRLISVTPTPIFSQDLHHFTSSLLSCHVCSSLLTFFQFWSNCVLLEETKKHLIAVYEGGISLGRCISTLSKTCLILDFVHFAISCITNYFLSVVVLITVALGTNS